MTTDELKPCPFCGEDAAVLDGKSDSCRVRCEACGTEGRPSFFSGDDQDAIDIAEDEARYGWNTRASPKQGEAADPHAPKELFLQLYGDSSADEGPVDYEANEVTWCWHRINDSDVRYVQAAPPLQQVEPGWSFMEMMKEWLELRDADKDDGDIRPLHQRREDRRRMAELEAEIDRRVRGEP